MSKLSKYGLLYSVLKKVFPEVEKAEKKVTRFMGTFLLLISLPFLGVGIYYASQYWDAHGLLATILLVIGAILFIPGLIMLIFSFTTSKENNNKPRK